MAGVLITGYGDSDNHANSSGWNDGNNFAAFIAAPTCGRADLLAAMRAGNLYSADPVAFKGTVYMEIAGAPMGSAVMCQPEQTQTLLLEVDNAGSGNTLAVYAAGVQIACQPVNGRLQTRLPVRASLPVTPVRAQLFAPSGRCTMLTNPIYLITDPSIFVPAERLHNKEAI